ncbi:HAD family hydrolase [Limobrevibacterium gyesilva]|uniref:HAD family phosphatase n=1 Tax=Limobrevibacterium gyesilva TaxID=2991712 RepID=A0AA41YJP7_9PROT|nr:HAD family phosphatase [Limobrevibacterium gyesilva]MCW3474989.1 HAD family phosphatase [Limobrevibacterium gyesilva]
MVFPSPVEAVLLDMDGTLLDTEQVYVGAMFGALVELGFAVPDALASAMVGLPGKECMGLLQGHFGAAFRADAFHAAYVAQRTERLRDGIPLKPGVIELLDHLAAAGLPTAVATSSSRSNAETNLGRAGLLARFGAVVTRDDVVQGKPDPALFLKAAAALGRPPGRCVAVEDSHVGVRAAHAAGTMPVMVPDMLPPNEEMRRICVAIAGDLHEVRALLALKVSVD